MYQSIPDLCSKAIGICADSEHQLCEIERELIGYDFVEVGGELLKRWTLPQGLWEPILLQSTPEKSRSLLLQTAIIHMAGAIADHTLDTVEGRAARAAHSTDCLADHQSAAGAPAVTARRSQGTIA